MNNRIIVYGVLAILVLAVAVGAFLLLGTGSVTVTTFPSDAKITVGAKSYGSGTVINLSQGKKDLIISRTGFLTRHIPTTIHLGSKIKLNVSLIVDSAFLANGGQLNLLPQDAAKGEGVTGQQIESRAITITKDNPLIQLLPYIQSTYRIDYGDSQKNPNSDAQAIYITASTPQAKQAALAWIKSEGYDPAKLEIIYQ